MGGFGTDLGESTSFTYICTAGNFGLRGTQAYSHSLVFDVAISDNVNYVLQSDLVAIGAGTPNGVGAGTLNDQVGINQYLFYGINDCCRIGGRIEWWKSDGVSFWEMTGGINYKPHANLVIRPEIRYDWQGNTVNAGGAQVTNVTTFGVDAIFTF